MSTIELKKKLIDRIQSTDNREILEEALRLLNIDGGDLEPYRLSDEQRILVKEARDQIKAGHSLSQEDADEQIRKWLEK
jgi:hypothetical protein